MSDGALEAQNAAGEFFGFERLEALLNELPADIDPQALIDRILGAVGEHLGGEEAQDDITLLAIRSRDGKLKTGAGKDTSAKGEE
jgi:sigma-B regulation protein RsbU (phosphoserine phosphatase)